ncbi:hypothetical protein AHAS_Ahas20G0042200 [Arachis hypogaea]
MNRDYFLVHFSYGDDYSHALMEGPWMIAGHYLIVQRWRPFFLFGSIEVRKIALWVRIPNLPIELYNHRFLWRVGSAIGHMLKVDRTTSIHSREKFARICVEIDLAKQLVPRISVLGCELHIEYEGLHQICFACGRYGHRSKQCMERPVTNGDPREEAGAGDIPSGEASNEKVDAQNGKAEDPQNPRNHDNRQINPDFGSWMLVKRYNFKKKAQSEVRKSHTNQGLGTNDNSKEGSSPKGKDPGAGSRFAILHEEAQKIYGKTQLVQKRVIKVGAGKNPHPTKKTGPGAKGGAEPSGKGNNNKDKATVSEKSLAIPKAMETPHQSCEREGKKQGA